MRPVPARASGALFGFLKKTMPRIFCPLDLASGALLDLPPEAARHVQVLRMQPGECLELFNGQGGAWQAEIVAMTRRGVAVQVGAYIDTDIELATPVHMAVSLPANERMDWLVEKATELGVGRITPLMSQRSVLRLSTAAGDARAEKKRAHWQAVAQSACAQCGRNRVPEIAPVQELGAWLVAQAEAETALPLYVLSPPQSDAAAGQATPFLLDALPAGQAACFLIGPEGGWADAELQAAQAAGAVACHLGPRVLRAETAPLFVLAALAARELATAGGWA